MESKPPSGQKGCCRVKAKVETCIVSDHVAEQVLAMARKFYSNPENVKKYQEWHLKTYGCLPSSFPNT
jgi:hypothetical protein